jgi:5'-3' exonuclease
MVTFRSNNSNNRRPPFRSSNNRRPPFRSNNEGSKFSNNDNFQRKVPGRNNHNAVKLIEKYNDLAREALANEDKILSENYFQHADHFTRVQNEQESLRMARVNSSPASTIVNSSPASTIKTVDSEKKAEEAVKTEVETVKKEVAKPEIKKVVKSIDKKVVEKKVAAN